MKKQSFKPKRPFKELAIHLDLGQPKKTRKQLVYPATLIIFFDDGKNISPIKGKEVADVKNNGTSIIRAIVPTGTTGKLITNGNGEVPFDISVPNKPNNHLIQVGIQWGKEVKWATERITVGSSATSTASPEHLLINGSDDREIYLNSLGGRGYFKPVSIDVGKAKVQVTFRSDGKFKIIQGKQTPTTFATKHVIDIDQIDNVKVKTSKDWQEIQVEAGKFTKTIICLK